MPENVLACPLCESSRHATLNVRAFRGRPVTNQVCLKCGMVFQSPRMSAAEADVFYAEEYRLLYEGSVDPGGRNLADQRGRAESLVAFARPFIGRVERHLDIGCSSGSLLKQFQEKYANQSVGVEPGDGHRALAVAQGMNVYASLDEVERNESTRFDLVSLAHVLEHLPDPVAYLGHLRAAVLAPEGWLLLEVPNLYAHDCFEVAHLLSFSPHTLKQTLAKAGYEVVRLEAHGRPRSQILPLYLTLLARPAPSLTFSLHPEKLVAVKRWIGMMQRSLLQRLFPKKAWLNQVIEKYP